MENAGHANRRFSLFLFIGNDGINKAACQGSKYKPDNDKLYDTHFLSSYLCSYQIPPKNPTTTITMAITDHTSICILISSP